MWMFAFSPDCRWRSVLPVATAAAWLVVCTPTWAQNDPGAPTWGAFQRGTESSPLCTGQRARELKVAEVSPQLQASGIVVCRDEGDAYVYTIAYVNFSLDSQSGWTSAHLEWFGCAVSRLRSEIPGGAAADNEWLYDEVRPISVQIRAGVKRVSVTNISFRVPKSVLDHAQGFGFYVVGGGTQWSIAFL